MQVSSSAVGNGPDFGPSEGATTDRKWHNRELPGSPLLDVNNYGPVTGRLYEFNKVEGDRLWDGGVKSLVVFDLQGA